MSFPAKSAADDIWGDARRYFRHPEAALTRPINECYPLLSGVFREQIKLEAAQTMRLGGATNGQTILISFACVSGGIPICPGRPSRACEYACVS